MAILPETIQSLPDVNIKGTFQAPITGVSIDTRTLSVGELFVAFKGTQVDGHDFIQKAISRGASAVMASTDWVGSSDWVPDLPLITTANPVKTLAALATAHRDRFQIPVIAITGTNGKTSTKNLMAHILEQRFSLLVTAGNFNNHIGLPLTLLKLNATHELAVLELGASQQGDIAYLCEIAKPTQGLITNIGLAHTEFFHTIDTIQATKGELFSYLKQQGGRAYINADDPRVAELAAGCSNPVYFAFEAAAEMVYSMTGPASDGCYDLYFGDYTAHLSQPGQVVARNAAAAATVALHNGLRYDQVQSALESDPGEPGRMEHLLLNNIDFYNDAYNANPASVASGLATIAELPARGRRLVIFADMLELGALSAELHLAAAQQILAAGFDHIILFGQAVSTMAAYLGDHDQSMIFYSDNQTAAIQHFLDIVQPEDLVYLKGSRGMHLEIFIQAYKDKS